MSLAMKKVLSFVLVLAMAIGLIPFAAFADEAQAANTEVLPASMEGLSIAYPYNTETVQLTGTPADHFDALTFESARGEVESAQMILTPNFNVDSFELTMNSLQNENGNIIPGWAFDVFVQHYVTVKGSGNATYWSDDHQMYNPTYSKNGYDGTFPDALIPQDAAIAAGENTITAGNNQGIWVNLNVQDAAPGTYTGSATLSINGSDMQIPVSIRVYDIELPEEIHATNFISVWWDMVQAAEGYLDRELADIYFDYLVSKRITPMDAWSVNRWDDALAEAAVEWAADPRITSYLITHTVDADGNFDAAAMKTKLTVMINKQLELGDSVDLFKKGYFYIYDEPRDDEEYRIANNITAQLDAMKAELAPMLDAYPSIQESFMDLKQVVTAPNPTDKTYSKVGSFWNYFINDDYGSTVLTGDSYIYVPQYQWLNIEEQRAMYADEEELWWYGCCHPIAPYPTYHINTPLVSARVESWMRYAYDIDGFLYSSVNIWGQYTDSGISLFDYWNGYTNNGTPGDQILVLPGSDYGVEGPIGTIRIENIREAQEDYEYLWMLENEYGISDISNYTANLYEGAIPSTDASIHYSNRKALLTKLEELNVAENGATEIAPGQEGFVRGELVDTTSGVTIQLDETVAAKAVTFDYKHISGDQFGFVLMKDWSNWYGYFDFDANGTIGSYDGVTCVSLDDGYIRVVIDLSNVTEIQENPGETLDFIYFSGSHGAATFYLDNLQVLTEVPEIEIPTEPPVTEPPATEPPVTEPPVTEPPQQVFEGGSFTAGSGITISLDNTQAVTKMSFDYKLTSDGYMNVALLPDWSSYFGYFKLDANGEYSDYNGVTTQKIANDYIRVFIDLASVTDIAGTPSDVITMLYVRGSYTTADGVIENIRINSSAYEPLRGTALTPGVNQSVDLDATEEIAIISFDYLITDDGKIGVALLPNWSSYFGYYDFYATGVQGDYPGVTTEVLEDGYVHVTMEIDELTSMAGDPSKIIDFIYIRGSYTTANGYIDNVQYVLKKDVPRGTALTPGVNQQIMVSAQETLISLSFDYKITAGEKMAVALMPNWSSFYGYFEFDAEATNTYTGVVCEKMDDGYIRVTFDMTSLDKMAGEPTTIIDFLFINGNYSNAEGYIDNVQYTVGCSHSYEAVVTAPTFTTNGFTTHTCANCGDSYIADEVAAYTFEVSQWGITLADDIRATFYLDVDSRIADATVQITVGNKSVSKALSSLNNEVSVNVAAAQMTEKISIQVIYGEAVSVEKTYTIRQYAEYILNGEYDDNTKVLVQNMLHYGAAAQSYFAYNANDLANKDYEITEVPEIPVAETGTIAQGTVNGIKYYGASLLFRTKIGVRFYFTVTGDINSYTFSNGATPTAKNGMYYVDILDINPNDYDQLIALSVTDGTESLEVCYSPLHYISRKYHGSDDAKLKALVAAMYQYHKAAETYLGEDIEKPEENVRGQQIIPGEGLTLELGNTEALETISFDYNVTSGTFNIALMPDWNSFYGYFAFNENGNVDAYDGVTLETLEDGYTRVTFDMAALTKCSGTPSNVIDFLYIRGNWTDANGYIDNITYTVYQPKQEFEGGDFVADTGATIVMDNDQAVIRMTFDYSIESGEYFHIALISEDWNNFFGYFKFDAAGAANNYDGVVTRELSDGSIRVYMDMTAVSTIAGTAPSDVVKLLYIRGSWTTANGTISNICINDAAEIAPRGELLEQTVGKNFELKTEGVLNSAAVDTLSFEYKIVDGTKFAVALMPDWSSYHGYFNFDANGATSDYVGVTTEALDDGYIRVTFQIEDLTASAGDPTAIITMLYFRGGYCEADVYIDNIQYEVAEPVDRGEAFKAGAQYYYYTECTDNMSLFSFDYKITNDGFIDIYIGNDSGRYGNYQLYANGEQTDYDGITTEVLEDGYICVTFQLDVLSGSTGASITYLRLRATTTATGFVDNMRWEAIRGTKFSAGANSYVYTDSTDELTQFVFDYKVTNDGVMDVLIGNGNGQYGNFYFDANGAVTSLSDNTAKNYDGVSVEVLGDGYIRVTLQLNELTTVYRGTPGNVIEYVRIRATTTADGYVDNLQLIV